MFVWHKQSLMDAAAEGVGGGDNPTTAFDAAAFKTELMAEVARMNNGTAAAIKKELAKAIAAVTASATPPPGEAPAGDPSGADPGAPKGTPDPAINAKMQSLERQIKTLTDGMKASEAERNTERELRLESERRAAIKDAMSAIPFRDQTSSEAFFKIVSSDIERDEEGNLVAKSDSGPLPVADYIRGMSEKLSGLLAPKGGGGSGASPGRAPANRQFTLDDIRPGMSPEDEREILAQAGHALRGR